MKTIGLDIGGTKIEGILAEFAGNGLPRVLHRVRTPTGTSRQQILGNIASVVSALRKGHEVKAVGIGIAGFLKNGRLEMVPNLPSIKGIRLKEVLAGKLKLPLVIQNDSMCFALAEFQFGAGQGTRNMIGLIIGTGIGSGLILDGRLFRGRDGAAGHLGHITIDPSGPVCGCGQKGHFEAWCSGRHITKRYVAAKGKIKNPDPARIFRSKENVARQVMLETYGKFGIALAGFMAAFNPELIVLGGGLSKLPDAFYVKIARAARSSCYPALSARIVRNKLGDDSGVFGAASLAADYVSSRSKSSP